MLHRRTKECGIPARLDPMPLASFAVRMVPFTEGLLVQGVVREGDGPLVAEEVVDEDDEEGEDKEEEEEDVGVPLCRAKVLAYSYVRRN